MSFSGLFFFFCCCVVVRFVVRELCRSGCKQNLENFYLAPHPPPPELTHSIFFIVRPVRATPNHKMEAASSVQQKDNMTDRTPRRLCVSHSSSMGPISARGDRSFQVRFGSLFGTNTKLLREVIKPISTPNDYVNTVFEMRY